MGDRLVHGLPVQVAGHWHAAVAGQYETCALDDADALWCWGDNSRGEIGDGTSAPRSAPVVVAPAAHSSVTIGSETVCELRSGELWCWGENDLGTFGDGTQTGTVVPEHVRTTQAWNEVDVSDSSLY